MIHRHTDKGTQMEDPPTHHQSQGHGPCRPAAAIGPHGSWQAINIYHWLTALSEVSIPRPFVSRCLIYYGDLFLSGESVSTYSGFQFFVWYTYNVVPKRWRRLKRTNIPVHLICIFAEKSNKRTFIFATMTHENILHSVYIPPLSALKNRWRSYFTNIKPDHGLWTLGDTYSPTASRMHLWCKIIKFCYLKQLYAYYSRCMPCLRAF